MTSRLPLNSLYIPRMALNSWQSTCLSLQVLGEVTSNQLSVAVWAPVLVAVSFPAHHTALYPCTHIHSPICLLISQAFSAPCQLIASHSSGNRPGRIWGVCVTMIQYFHSYLAGHLCFFHSFALISTNRYQSQALCTAWERGKGNVENLSIHKCIQILRARKGLLDPISAFQRLINQSLASVCMFP